MKKQILIIIALLFTSNVFSSNLKTGNDGTDAFVKMCITNNGITIINKTGNDGTDKTGNDGTDKTGNDGTDSKLFCQIVPIKDIY